MISTISAIFYFCTMHAALISHLIQYYFIENISYVENIFNNWRKLLSSRENFIKQRKYLIQRENNLFSIENI